MWVLGVGKANSGLVDVEELSKHQINEVISRCHEVLKKKYKKRRKKPIYGRMNKGFTLDELERFFQVQMNKKARMCFSIMAFMGLRIGEVNNIKLEDVDFNNNKLRVHTEKAKTVDFMYIPPQIRRMLWCWVEDYQERITNSQDYLFFSDNPNSSRLFISADWLRSEFRRVCGLADLTESYGERDGGGKLYRHTTHSLRHFFGTTIYRNTKDLIKTQHLLRHTEPSATKTYIATNQSELDQVMASVFGGGEDQNMIETR